MLTPAPIQETVPEKKRASSRVTRLARHRTGIGRHRFSKSCGPWQSLKLGFPSWRPGVQEWPNLAFPASCVCVGGWGGTLK
jgi:hypothetical protein